MLKNREETIANLVVLTAARDFQSLVSEFSDELRIPLVIIQLTHRPLFDNRFRR